MTDRNLSKYQVIHLAKLLSNPTQSLLISDGVGVGKTVSAGYIIYYVNKILEKPSIVLCPPILEDKWRMDLKLRFDLDSFSAKANEDYELMIEELSSNQSAPKIYILPYSMASRRKLPPDLNFGLVVMDEIHHARNPSTNLYSSLQEFCSSADYRIGLTATPVQNSIDDLAASMSLLNPIASFLIWRLLISELWARGKLSSLSPFVTKFTKDRLGVNFTKRIIHRIEVEFPASYSKFIDSSLDSLGDERGKQLSAFEKTTFLRLASSSPEAFFGAMKRVPPKDYPNPKIDRLLQEVESSEPGRWIIFTEFRRTAELLMDRLADYEPTLISGKSSFSERFLAFDDFRENPEGILVMMPVGSEGLDLQVCSRMINFDLHWNPMVIEQRIGRIDRLGQKKTEIQVFNFLVRGGIDEHMMAILKSKLGLIKDTFASTEEVISEGTRPLSIAQHFSDSSTKEELDLYIQGQRFYAQSQELDYELIELIDANSCECEDWKKTENWLNNHITTSTGSKEAINNFSSIAMETIRILEELGE